MMTYQVNSSVPTAKALISRGSFSCGPADAPGFTSYRSFGMGAGGGRAAFRHSQTTNFPLMQPMNKSRNENAFLNSFILKGTPCGTPHLMKDDKLGLENIPQGDNTLRKHFLFDKTNTTRSMLPPLPRDSCMHRSANLHPFSFSRELPLSHAGQPFTLSYPKKYKVNTSPPRFLPSALILTGRNMFPVQNFELTRPKVNCPKCHPMTVKTNQKSPSYQDPMVGASRSFIHQITKLSALQDETVRQENLKRMKKSRRSS